MMTAAETTAFAAPVRALANVTTPVKRRSPECNHYRCFVK